MKHLKNPRVEQQGTKCTIFATVGNEELAVSYAKFETEEGAREYRENCEKRIQTMAQPAGVM